MNRSWLTLFFLFSMSFINLYGAPFLNYIVPIEITEPDSGLDTVDAIYMINLDRRPERLAYMNAVLGQHGLHPNRVSACDGLSISDAAVRDLLGPYYPVNLFHRSNRGSINAAIGCFLSHLSILQDAYEREFGVIWVIEDDVKILGDIQQIPIFLSKLFTMDPDWDICYTDQGIPNALLILPPDSTLPRDRVRKEEKGEFDLIRWRYGTYSMIISQNGAKKIRDYFLSSYIYGPIDNDLHLVPGIREYSIPFDLVVCGFMFKSDIEH